MVRVVNLPGCLDNADCYLPSIGNQERFEVFHSRKVVVVRCVTCGMLHATGKFQHAVSTTTENCCS